MLDGASVNLKENRPDCLDLSADSRLAVMVKTIVPEYSGRRSNIRSPDESKSGGWFSEMIAGMLTVQSYALHGMPYKISCIKWFICDYEMCPIFYFSF